MGAIGTVLLYAGGGLLMVGLMGLLLRPVRRGWQVAINCLLGALLLAVFNHLAAPYGYHVGLNPITAVFAGAFGLPGVLVLAALAVFYK